MIDKEIGKIQIRTGAAFTISAILASVGIVIFYQNIEVINNGTIVGFISFIFGFILIGIVGRKGQQEIRNLSSKNDLRS